MSERQAPEVSSIKQVFKLSQYLSHQAEDCELRVLKKVNNKIKI